MTGLWVRSFGLFLGITISLTACNQPTAIPMPLTRTVGIPTASPRLEPTKQTPVPPSTLTPTATATQSVTPEPPTATHALTPFSTRTSSKPFIQANVDTNCRSGPGPEYDIVGYLLVGERVEILGRNDVGGWWYIRNPKQSDRYCWVWNGTINIEGDSSILPFITAPPTPTPTSTPMPELSVVMIVNPNNYTGACPITLDFTATISSSQATTITYQWERSDGTVLPKGSMIFLGSSTQFVTNSWTLDTNRTGWMRFHILSPIDHVSNQASFTLSCKNP